MEAMVRRGVLEHFNPAASSFNIFSSREQSNARDSSFTGTMSVKRSVSGIAQFQLSTGMDIDPYQEKGIDSCNSSRMPPLFRIGSNNSVRQTITQELPDLSDLRDQMALMATTGGSFNPLLNEVGTGIRLSCYVGRK